MKLAASVGVADYNAVLDSLSEQQFTDWMAFDAHICPIGPGRLDTAIACAMTAMVRYLASFAGDKSTEIQELTPQSFMPWLPDEAELESPEEEARREQMEATAARVNLESARIAAAAARRGTV